MGCFDKTCCLSNTGISAGEQCLVIVPNSGVESNFYEVNRRVYDQFKQNKTELSGIDKGLIKKNPGMFNSGYFLPIKYVFYGTYNDYGSIEEDELIPEDYEEYRMAAQMFHLWAIEELFNDNIDNLIKKPLKLVVDLYSKLYFLRKSPFDLELSGQQHKDIKEMELMIKMNKRTNQYLKSKIEEHMEWGDEDNSIVYIG